MRVMALGTSSGRPTRDRHVSAFAVVLGARWVLVDCGDGTQHQILRSPLSEARLDAVLLTHLHGDHTLGLPALLATMGLEGRTRPLELVGPRGLRQWLDATASLPLLKVDFPLVLTELDEHDDDDVTSPVTTIEGHRVETLALRHRVPCFGYRITEPDHDPHLLVEVARSLGVSDGPDLGRLRRGESVTIGGRTITPDEVLGAPRRSKVVAVFGDTVPCTNGVTLGRDADLLVHEATYGDQHVALAEQWTHSTARQAAGIAREAGVRRLLLTHFSSRHPDPSLLVDEARTVFEATDAAVELDWVEVD